MHLLVAAYLGYKPPPAATPYTERPRAAASADEAPAALGTWLPGGRHVPPSQAFIDATTPADALAAAERMFFGDVIQPDRN